MRWVSARRWILGLAVAAVACGSSSPVGTKRPKGKLPPAPDRRLQFQDTAEIRQLRNGMTVLVAPMPGARLAQVSLRLRSGAREDPRGKRGVAHLTEHVILEAQPDDSGKSLFARMTASSLYTNAFTSADYTEYTATTLPARLDELIELQLQLLRVDCVSLPEPVFTRELEVVLNELRQRQQAMSTVAMAAYREIYTPAHPYRRASAVDGDAETRELGLADVCKFIEDHYVPKNAIVVITGNVEPEAAFEAVARLATGIEDSDPPVHAEVELEVRTWAGKSAEAAVRQPTLLGHAEIARPFTDMALAYEVAADVLRSELDVIASEVDGVGDSFAFTIGGPRQRGLVFGVTVADETARAAVEKRLAKSFAELSKPTVDDKETEFRIVALRNRSFFSYLSSLDHVGARATHYADHLQYSGSTRLLVGELERMQALESRLVRFAYKKIGERARYRLLMPATAKDERRLAAGSYVPNEEWEEAHGAELSPGEALRPLAIPKPEPPKVQRVVLSNGLDVLMAQSSLAPIFEARLVFRAGALDDPEGHRGLAWLASDYPFPEKPADILDWIRAVKYGVSAWPATGWDRVTFLARGLAGAADQAVYLASYPVLIGTPPEKFFQRRRKARGRALADRSREARRMADIWRRAMAGSRLANLEDESAESVRAVSYEDVERFRRNHFHPENGTLIVTGNFDPALIEKHVRYWLEGWESDGSPPQRTEHRLPPARTTRFVVEPSKRPQGRIQIVFELPGRLDPKEGAHRDLYAELLRQELAPLRTKLAITYGTKVSLTNIRESGLITVDIEFDRARTKELLTELPTLLGAALAPSPNPVPFAIARRRAVRRALGGGNDAGSLSSRLAEIAEHDLDTSYFEDKARAIAATVVSELGAWSQKRRRPALVLVHGIELEVEEHLGPLKELLSR